jgi:hypothetical protein
MPLFGSEDDGDFAVQMNGHHRALFNLLTDFAEQRELEDSEVLMLLVETTLSIATIESARILGMDEWIGSIALLLSFRRF